MSTKIQLRRGTEEEWSIANPTLSSGEFGYETDTGKVKVGDGTTNWNSLDYQIIGPFDENGVLEADALPAEIDSALIPTYGDVSAIDAYVGQAGELATDGETIRLMDGVFPGGTKMAALNDIQSSGSNLTFIVDAGVLNGYSVTEVPNSWFFNDAGVTALQIGNSVASIGAGAFSGCTNLAGSLVIPDSVTSIESSAFYNCTGFTGSLTIPDSVTTIGSNAFDGCSGFSGSLTIGNSVTSIGSYAFAYCYGFSGSLVIPNSVTTIGQSAFRMAGGFDSLTLGSSMTSIGSGAFYQAGIGGHLIIPDTVTTIGDSAFASCSFTGITFGNSVTSIGFGAFELNYGLTEITIPNSVTSIGSNAFFYCTSLTNVNCYVTRTIMNTPSCLLASGVTTLHARASDGTWTAGADTIGDKALTVIKDL